jgi:hypothetical protein
LCQQSNENPFCHLVFYCSSLKRALVFKLGGTTDSSQQLRYGTKYLEGFGFQLEPLNLDLKPAMRETVLRDLPSLQKPEFVRRTRQERQARIASLEKTLKILGKPAPASKEGLEHKRTLEQLNAERKIDEHLQTLREHFEQELSTLEKKLGQPPPDPAALPKASETDRQELPKAEQKPGGEKRLGQKLEQDSGTPISRQPPQNQEPATTRSRQASAAAEPPDRKQAPKSHGQPDIQINRRPAAEPRAKEVLKNERQEIGAELKPGRQIPDVSSSRKAESAEQVNFLGQAEAQLEKLRQELAASVAAHKVELAARKQLEAELAAGRKGLTERESQLQQAVKQSRDEIDGTRKELAAARKKLEEAEQGREKSAVQLADIRKQLIGAQQELTGLQKQLAAQDTEFAKLKVESDTLAKQLKMAEKAGKDEEKARLVLEGQIKDLRTKIAESDQANRYLGEQLTRAGQDVERERGEKDALSREAAQSAARLKNLEDKLVRLQAALKSAASAGDVAEQLQSDLDQLRGRYEALTRENAILVDEFAAARMKFANLDRHALAELQKSQDGAMESPPYSAGQTVELRTQLSATERQLKDLARQQEQMAADYAAERQKCRALEDELEQASRVEVPAAPVTAVKHGGGQKPPHVRRPSPLPGAFFQVDWDLTGLPCEIEMVGQLWRAIYNVTLSVEGYPHQYVGALIVLLKQGAGNRLFVLLRLEGERRNLVYRPAKPIDNDQAVKKGLDEAQKFLRVSGIEVETVPAGQVKDTLQPYLPE